MVCITKTECLGVWGLAPKRGVQGAAGPPGGIPKGRALWQVLRAEPWPVQLEAASLKPSRLARRCDKKIKFINK